MRNTKEQLEKINGAIKKAGLQDEINVKLSLTNKRAVQSEFNPKYVNFRYNVNLLVNDKLYTTYYNDSVNNFRQNKKDKDIIVRCFNCLLLDSICYNNTGTFESFCNKFGYDEFEDRTRATKAYEGCKRAFTFFSRFLTEEEIYKLNEEIENSY